MTFRINTQGRIRDCHPRFHSYKYPHSKAGKNDRRTSPNWLSCIDHGRCEPVRITRNLQSRLVDREEVMLKGTSVIMPDTPENQAAYPQVYNQRRGLGFPIARVGALTSLACGAILNLGVCRYAGKGQGEVSLLRQLWDVLRPGDVLFTDSSEERRVGKAQ